MSDEETLEQYLARAQRIATTLAEHELVVRQESSERAWVLCYDDETPLLCVEASGDFVRDVDYMLDCYRILDGINELGYDVRIVAGVHPWHPVALYVEDDDGALVVSHACPRGLLEALRRTARDLASGIDWPEACGVVEPGDC